MSQPTSVIQNWGIHRQEREHSNTQMTRFSESIIQIFFSFCLLTAFLSQDLETIAVNFHDSKSSIFHVHMNFKDDHWHTLTESPEISRPVVPLCLQITLYDFFTT